MAKIQIKKFIFIFIFFISPFLLITFIYTFSVIYKGVKANCLRAQTEFGDDCIDSLIKTVRSEDKTYRERNSAIWALGQLADKRALPFLYELNKTLPNQEKCRYDQYLCKYEVQKAIKWCEKGNITSWMYRHYKE